MARMIPSGGPQDSDSFAEGLIYRLLKVQLDDRFTVIHSLPWLCSKAKEIDDSYAPTGEIDFLILHQELGVLALEVKGGRYRVSELRLVHIKKGYSISPVRQTRRNVHGLGTWLGSDPDLRIRIGYGLVFPDSTFGDATVSAALNDVSVTPPESIVIDMGDVPRIGERVVELMEFWSRANRTGPLSFSAVNKLVEKLCPEFDGTPAWGARVMYDNQLWLQLTPEQSIVVKRAISTPRMVITGWPGTGKTLVGVACAREAANSGKHVLFLTYNNLLARYLEQQFSGDSSVTVYTWHKFCWEMRRRLPESDRQPAEKDGLWLKAGCGKDLALASTRGLLDAVELIVVDEAQALRPDWWEILVAAFRGSSIIAMCDETQVFPFEKDTTPLSVLCETLSVPKAFALTVALRNPKAVTDRLQAVVSPEYQLTSPRQFEEDSIREIVTKTVWTTVVELIESLKNDGVRASDIAVLTKFPTAYESELEKLGVFYEVVSKFRGMESPIVIVPSAQEFDDVELFCAYSRTTSACIALYNAEVLGWADDLGQFATSVLSLPENKRLADEARLHSTTAHLAATFLEPVNQSTKSVNLAWTPVWNGWLVELDTDHDVGLIWPEFLVTAFGWPVYFWHKDDRGRIVRVSPDRGDVNDVRFEYGLTALFCTSCEMLAPHTFSPKDGHYECKFCTSAYSLDFLPPSVEIVQKIKEYDAILGCEAVMTSTLPEVTRLPLALIALACLREIDLSKIAADKRPQIRSGSPIYRRALAMLYWQIHTRPGEKFVTAELAEKWHTKFHSIQEMDLKDWKSKVAMAVSTCNMRKLVVAERKGFYSVLCA